MADKKEKADFFDWEGQVKHHLKEIDGVDIPEENKELIKKFEERSQVNIKSRLNYIITLKKFLGYAPKKPFREFERDDFNKWIKHLDGKYRPYTVNNYLMIVRRFFRFVFNLEEDETPPCMKGIKKKKIDRGEQETKLRKSILTKEEILKMINMTTNRKYRAMISVLFDSALRKSEFINLKIRSLEIHDDYIDVTVEGKGGRVDMITLIDSVPYLRDWLSVHPFRNNPKAPLWIKERNEGKPLQVKEWVIGWLIKDLAKKSGVNKKVWVHLTRHSKCSSMLAEGYSIAEVAKHARHRSLSSTLLYTHVTDNGLREKMLAKSGKLSEKQKPGNLMKPIVCERCQDENPATNKFCARCGWEFGKDMIQVKLESEKQKIAKEFMNFVMDNPEASKHMENMMRLFVRKKQIGEEKNL